MPHANKKEEAMSTTGATIQLVTGTPDDEVSCHPFCHPVGSCHPKDPCPPSKNDCPPSEDHEANDFDSEE